MKQNYTFKMTMTKLNDRKKAANLSNPINVLKLESQMNLLVLKQTTQVDSYKIKFIQNTPKAESITPYHLKVRQKQRLRFKTPLNENLTSDETNQCCESLNTARRDREKQGATTFIIHQNPNKQSKSYQNYFDVEQKSPTMPKLYFQSLAQKRKLVYSPIKMQDFKKDNVQTSIRKQMMKQMSFEQNQFKELYKDRTFENLELSTSKWKKTNSDYNFINQTLKKISTEQNEGPKQMYHSLKVQPPRSKTSQQQKKNSNPVIEFQELSGWDTTKEEDKFYFQL